MAPLLNRGGRAQVAALGEGGLQGYVGGLGAGNMRDQWLLKGGGYTRLQIDDVVYDFDFAHADFLAGTSKLFKAMGGEDDDLSYPLGATKSITGEAKFGFLTEPYLDGGYVALPMCVSIKAGAGRLACIRTLRGDVGDYMSNARGIERNELYSLASYISGVTLDMCIFMRYSMEAQHSDSHASAELALAHPSECGLGVP